MDMESLPVKVDNQTVRLQIWDTAGDEKFAPVTNSYFVNSDGAVLVYDLTDKDSANNLHQKA